ncbi:hypothetical protein RHSIM_Rhsim10G0160700 [Rhododendron simsii]|uniref:Uncharacterized protein n=1 Tax=Rhododendron simsii TaxID=118357 RepID=A0A834GAT2_RHOSS|nr:hypothetical protein RHSIM_RhsimUnG0245100 [Rhododendron simsii]KAF7129866.1 hypothetical protein RHSIM_Rhsim10G0160700 [Rhododendron simsii]
MLDLAVLLSRCGYWAVFWIGGGCIGVACVMVSLILLGSAVGIIRIPILNAGTMQSLMGPKFMELLAVTLLNASAGMKYINTEAANYWTSNRILDGSLSDPQVPLTEACL